MQCVIDHHLRYIRTPTVKSVGMCGRSTPSRHAQAGSFRREAKLQRWILGSRRCNESSSPSIAAPWRVGAYMIGLRGTGVRWRERLRDPHSEPQTAKQMPRPVYFYGRANILASSALTHSHGRRLCHGLCHNPAIPASIGQSITVSLRHTRQAENMR